jgi:hypothetical protein
LKKRMAETYHSPPARPSELSRILATSGSDPDWVVNAAQFACRNGTKVAEKSGLVTIVAIVIQGNNPTLARRHDKIIGLLPPAS